MVDHQIDETELIPRKEAKLRFRDQILLRWDYKCAYCQTTLVSKQATLDHVVPKAKGGPTVRENMVPACPPCNISKSARPWSEWLREQAFHTLEREAAIHEWINA